MPRVPGCEAVYEVADQWRDRCLMHDGSLLWPTDNVWNTSNTETVSRILEGAKDSSESDDFFVRTVSRLSGYGIPPLKLLADTTVIWSLPLSIYTPERKLGWLQMILEAGSLEPSSIEELVSAAFRCRVNAGEGVRSRHAYRRGNQICAILEFSRRVKSDKVDLADYDACKLAFQEIIPSVPFSRDAENFILHLLFPNEHEPITSGKSKREIVEHFPELAVPGNVDQSIRAIRDHLVESGKSKTFSFYDPEIYELWSSGDNVEDSDRESSGSITVPIGKMRDTVQPLVVTLTNLTVDTIAEIESLLQSKKQIILEGPPGSGKTYVARLFARYLAGLPLQGEPDEHVEIVQFHQSYGYEDFVAGIRPVTNPDSGQLTYETRPGIFVEMCQRALAKPEDTFVLIIDEINRGNLSRIFGELLYGLEYRDQPVRMQYPVMIDGVEQQHLTIPENLYLIGTMNSTDRSLAMIDYALRRRFYFWRLMPVEGNDAPVLRRWLASQPEIDPTDRAELLQAFITLNTAISQELGPDYQIGHSYFMLDDGALGNPDALERVWAYAIEPLLREYFHTRRDVDSQLARFRNLFFGSPATILDDLDMDELAL